MTRCVTTMPCAGNQTTNRYREARMRIINRLAAVTLTLWSLLAIGYVQRYAAPATQTVYSWSTSNDSGPLGDWDSYELNDAGTGCTFEGTTTHMEGTGAYHVAIASGIDNYCYLKKSVGIKDYSRLTLQYQTADFNVEGSYRTPVIWLEGTGGGDSSIRLDQSSSGILRLMEYEADSSATPIATGTWYTIILDIDVPTSVI